MVNLSMKLIILDCKIFSSGQIQKVMFLPLHFSHVKFQCNYHLKIWLLIWNYSLFWLEVRKTFFFYTFNSFNILKSFSMFQCATHRNFILTMMSTENECLVRFSLIWGYTLVILKQTEIISVLLMNFNVLGYHLRWVD